MNADAFLHEQKATINHLVFNQVHTLGGSISAEHGVGSPKATTLPQYKNPVTLALMRRVRQTLAPQGLLNPGWVLTLGDN